MLSFKFEVNSRNRNGFTWSLNFYSEDKSCNDNDLIYINDVVKKVQDTVRELERDKLILPAHWGNTPYESPSLVTASS